MLKVNRLSKRVVNKVGNKVVIDKEVLEMMLGQLETLSVLKYELEVVKRDLKALRASVEVLKGNINAGYMAYLDRFESTKVEDPI